MLIILPNQIQVRSYSLDYLDVTWEVVPTTEPLDLYHFEVLRAESPGGPYVLLAGPFEDAYWFRDTTVSLHRRDRHWYYRVRITNKQTGEAVEYPEVGGEFLRAQPSLEAIEMARLLRLELESGGGRLVYLYPRRTHGQRCDCVDVATDEGENPKCTTCYTTGYVGGFHRPIPIYARIGPNPKQRALTTRGDVTDEASFIEIADFPLVMPGWVVVELENQRWRVGEKVTPIEHHRHVVRQYAQLDSIALGDIEYQLPVLDPGDSPLPEWAYTNVRSSTLGHARASGALTRVYGG